MLDGPVLLFAAESSRPIWWYWEQCDQFAKCIVILLAALSVWSGTTIFQKILDLKKLRRDNLAFERRLPDGMRFSGLALPPRAGTTGSPYERVLARAIESLNKHRGKITNADDVRVCMSHVENAIQREIGRATAIYEDGMTRLSTFISGGPFLGLLGTVWGVMVTFGALTEKATISQLAPGVSGALVATTAGLLLAIPASFAYNWALGSMRNMCTELDNFSSAIADEMEIELLETLREEHGNAASAATPPPPPSGNPFLRDDVAGTPGASAGGAGDLRSRGTWG